MYYHVLYDKLSQEKRKCYEYYTNLAYGKVYKSETKNK